MKSFLDEGTVVLKPGVSEFVSFCVSFTNFHQVKAEIIKLLYSYATQFGNYEKDWWNATFCCLNVFILSLEMREVEGDSVCRSVCWHYHKGVLFRNELLDNQNGMYQRVEMVQTLRVFSTNFGSFPPDFNTQMAQNFSMILIVECKTKRNALVERNVTRNS